MDQKVIAIEHEMVVLRDQLREIRLTCAHANVERKTTMVACGVEYQEPSFYVTVYCLDCGKTWTEYPQ